MYQRTLVSQLEKRLKEPRNFMQFVVGPRQTGKTTALKQALNLVDMPHRYTSADDPTFLSEEWLRNEWELARVQQKEAQGEFVLVIDEIQKIDNWSAMVKLLWDQDSFDDRPLKVVLSGSSSMLLHKGMSESLMGRFEILHSTHWSYQECRDSFNFSLEDFLNFGGYPGAAHLIGDTERWNRYIGLSVVEPTISIDVMQMAEIRKPALLKALFVLGSSYSGQELSYTKILGQLHDAGNTVTLAHYLDLLSKAGMLSGLQKYSSQKVASQKSSPRFLVHDTALMMYSSDGGRERVLYDRSFRGHLVESAVGAFLLARGLESGFEVHWWREREKEVDFIIRKGDALTAIEVKSGRVKSLGGSMDFIKKHPHALSLIIGGANCSIEEFLLGQVPLFKE